MTHSPTKPPNPDELRAKLESEILQGQWTDIKAHLDRDAVFVISQELPLVDAGCAVVSDDVTSIQSWLSSGRIARPTIDQVSGWNLNPEREFKFLITAPYVLIQELGH